MLKVNSAFIDNKTNLKCYPTLINNDTLHSNTFPPLVVTNNSGNKICIPKNRTVGTSEEMS